MLSLSSAVTLPRSPEKHPRQCPSLPRHRPSRGSGYFFSSATGTGKTQKTLAREIVMSGRGLHSGVDVVVRLFPAKAGEGRYFVLGDNLSIVIPACINFAVESALCTTLSGQGMKVRTTEHLLSALEAMGVDNCRIEMVGGDEVPLLDGSARRWVDAVEEAALCDAVDDYGRCIEKLAPFVVEPVHILCLLLAVSGFLASLWTNLFM